MKVRNMTGRTGKPVANQFIIEYQGARYFQSYNTIIVREKYGLTCLDENAWDYSATTGRYRNQFLSETKAETEKKIKDGTYRLENLNA